MLNLRVHFADDVNQKIFFVATQRFSRIRSLALYSDSSVRSWAALWDKVFFNTFRATWFRRFLQKNSSFRLPYQRPSSSAHCARELFSGSNGSSSLVDCTRKKNFSLGGAYFLWNFDLQRYLKYLSWQYFYSEMEIVLIFCIDKAATKFNKKNVYVKLLSIINLKTTLRVVIQFWAILGRWVHMPNWGRWSFGLVCKEF